MIINEHDYNLKKKKKNINPNCWTYVPQLRPCFLLGILARPRPVVPYLSRRNPRSDWPPPHRRCRWPRRSGRPSSSWWRSAACRTFSARNVVVVLQRWKVPVLRGEPTKFQWRGWFLWFGDFCLSWLGFCCWNTRFVRIEIKRNNMNLVLVP